MQPVSPASTDSTRAGIFWMLLTMFFFASMDTCAKILVSYYPTMQVVWGRYVFQVVVLLIVLAPRIPKLIRTQSLKLQLIRSLFLLGTTLCFFTALNTIQVAEGSAIMFTVPLIVTAAAPLVLKEKVGIRRWLSVLAGFIGALIIIRPGNDAFAVGAFWALAAAVCNASYQLSTRALSGHDSVLTTLFYSAFLGALIMTLIVPPYFVMFELKDLAIVVLLGTCGTLGHFCMIKALTHAEASKVAPYSYTNLIWASVFGFVLFGSIPDIWTYVGAGIIIASGIYIIHRERKNRR